MIKVITETDQLKMLLVKIYGKAHEGATLEEIMTTLEKELSTIMIGV